MEFFINYNSKFLHLNFRNTTPIFPSLIPTNYQIKNHQRIPSNLPLIRSMRQKLHQTRNRTYFRKRKHQITSTPVGQKTGTISFFTTHNNSNYLIEKKKTPIPFSTSICKCAFLSTGSMFCFFDR